MKVDAELIDELVTGQLSGQRYRDALKAIDAQPEKWRDCALAFLEDQALRQELTLLSKSDAPWARPNAVDLAASAPNDASHGDASAAGDVVAGRDDFKLGWSAWGRGLFSTAALLLVGISMGWGVSEIATDASRSGVSSDRGDTPSQVAKSPAPQAQYVADNQLLQFDREIPAALLELQRQGKIRLESIDGIVPITYEDGTPAIVPVHEFKVIPISQSF